MKNMTDVAPAFTKKKKNIFHFKSSNDNKYL